MKYINDDDSTTTAGRQCYLCGEFKEWHEFPKSNRRCTQCNRRYAQSIYQANKTERLLEIRVNAASRTAKRHGVEDDLTLEQFKIKLLNADYKCERCGEEWECVHHLWPLGWGGANTFDNIAIRCEDCHKLDHQELWKIRRYQVRASKTEKTCLHCGETKPLEKFHRDSGAVDGRLSTCGVCRSVQRKTQAVAA